MKKEIKTFVYVCDGCGAEFKIDANNHGRTYYFSVREYEPYGGYTDTQLSYELCRDCQSTLYEDIGKLIAKHKELNS